MPSKMRLASNMKVFLGFFILLIAQAAVCFGAQLDALNLSYSALVPSGAPFWIAQDLKLFEREALRTQLVYINAAPE
jgi:ABC-type nitrate/sulfonate/bicarbonate transport system substrate-binding protein